MRFTIIKRLRLERGLLQLDVAHAASISAPRLSLIENAHSAPTSDELERLARALGVPVEALKGSEAP